MKRHYIVACVVLLTACSDKSETTENSLVHDKKFAVTIDWVPSPEYYGFFVAKRERLYDKAHLDVKINYGSGAPAVANQIAAGSIYAGTTTSDNILRQLARGGSFSTAVPLLRFNPAVICSLEKSPIASLQELVGKTLGVNKQSSVYQQLQYLVASKQIDSGAFKEYPIGWSGSEPLRVGQVDAILAYATNDAIDLLVKGLGPKEIFFSEHGVQLYGTVLVIAAPVVLAKEKIADEDIQKFVEATLEGYRIGGDNPKIAADALIAAEPTLKREKIEAAVARIKELNASRPAVLSKLDDWVIDGDIPTEVRARAKAMYGKE
jgi:NitT/TauT family transport system substrate-binding protein